MPENATSSSPSASPEPRNLIRLWICVVVGVALWFSPTPAGLTNPAWHIFAVFAATIVSFLLRPLPMGVCVLVGLLVLAVSGELAPQWVGKDVYRPLLGDVIIVDDSLNQVETAARTKASFKKSLSGFADTTTWLVVVAMLLAGAMVRSGLGRRLALMLISRLGGTTLGLGYGVALAEIVLGPFIPSNTARGGGVMAPIVNSLAHALDPVSRERQRPDQTSTSPAGRYLVLVAAHANLVTAAMFLTGMAANPLVVTAAQQTFGEKFEFGWGMWALGAVVPGLVSLALLPLVIGWLAPPGANDSTTACTETKRELAAMGAWTSRQVALAIVLLAMLAFWATAPLQKMWLGYALPTALVAITGVVALVVLGVEKWQDVIGNAAAWDTLVWLGGLITMAGALRDTGFTAWLGENAGGLVAGWPALAAAIGLAVLYFYSMYAFSMLTGHILALAGVLFAVGAAAGAPPLLLVPLVAYFSNLCGCLTNYSSGPIVIYFGLGYVPIGRWFGVGFAMSLLHLTVWLGVGLPWWKLLGWW